MNGLQRSRVGLFVQASSSLFNPGGQLKLRCSAALLVTYEFEALRILTPASTFDGRHSHHHHHGHQTAARNLHQLEHTNVHSSIGTNAIDQESESYADAGVFYLTQGTFLSSPSSSSSSSPLSSPLFSSSPATFNLCTFTHSCQLTLVINRHLVTYVLQWIIFLTQYTCLLIHPLTCQWMLLNAPSTAPHRLMPCTFSLHATFFRLPLSLPLAHTRTDTCHLTNDQYTHPASASNCVHLRASATGSLDASTSLTVNRTFNLIHWKR